MKAKRPAVSSEDQALFLAAVGDATPLAARDRIAIPPPPPSPVRVEVLPPEVKLAAEVDGERYAARAPGVSRTQIAELRAGKLRVDATLDLHGDTVVPALARLRTFLVESRQLGRRCVLLIHGKGTHSEHGAPLRDAVIGELLGACSGLVHALSSAAPGDGGAGATYVALRGSK